MSGVEFPSPPSKLVLPNAYKGSDGEIVDGYFGGTPFHNLFYARIPFSIPDDPYRMEHTFILGGSGAGKSTLIQQIVLDDLAKPNPPPMVIIDPKGQLVDRISWLEAFSPEDGRLKDRLVIVDPDDSPALNMFHAADRWNRMYDDSFRHQLQSQAIRNFTYIFSSIESSLTPRQSVCFTFCIHLLFLFKGANVTTLMELLDDPAKSLSESTFRPTVERLDPTPLQFFKNDYYSTAYKETRQEVKRRLYGIIMHPQLLAMFSTPERKIDLYDCIQQRRIVLVNGSLGTPGSEASQLFCRYFVTLTLNAIFERNAIKDRTQWHPRYLIVDEFQLVADDVKTPEMLRLAREYNLGVTLAFQEIHGKPFNDSLRASISTNTSIKYASSPEGTDINYVARDLRCDVEFIRAQTKTSTHGKFACFVRGLLERPVSLTVPFGNIQAEPQMTTEQHSALRKANKERLSANPEPEASAPEPEVHSQPKPSSAPVAPTDDPDAGEHTEAAPNWGD